MDILFIREPVKKALTAFNIHRQGEKKDILILSAPRSGSTWLMEVIYSQPGIKYINGVLAKNLLDYHNLLPIRHRWRYCHLEPHEEPLLRDYFGDERKTRIFGPKNLLGRDYNFYTDRRVIKLIRANPLCEWFANNLDVHMVYLIRHPIAQSLSSIRRGHNHDIEEFVNDETFVNSYLNGELVNLVTDILETGSKLEKFVTSYCLDNLVPLRKLDEHPDWLVITYEELVLRPKEVIELLCEKLELEDKQAMLSKITVPSKTTDSSTAATRLRITKQDSGFLVNKWRQEVTEEQEKSAFHLLDRFGINPYERNGGMPNSRLLNF